MDFLSYYLPYKNKDGHIYSCDMIRLKFCFMEDKDGGNNLSLDFMYHVSFAFGYKVERFTSNRISGFKYMFVFKKDDSVITCGFFSNKADSAGYHSNFIEFNPNKADICVAAYLMQYFVPYNAVMGRGVYYELIRFDLAVDIPIERQYVKLVKTGKKTYKRVEDKSLTEYLGQRNANGFTKVYDKTEESGLYYDCTRIEVTCDTLEPTLPDIYILEYQNSIDFDFDLDDTDKVLVQLIRRCDDDMDYWFKKLGRRKREKLHKYIYADNNKFSFDRHGLCHVVTVVENIVNLIFEGDIYDKINEQHTVSCKQPYQASSEPAPSWSEMIPDINERGDMNEFSFDDSDDNIVDD